MNEPQRCPWCLGSDTYIHYHDHEWGVPSRDDRHLFEMLILEGAQAGLSWSTILNKRDNYRRAFDNFDPERIARYSSKRVEKLLGDAGIVRNRLKVQSTVTNARAWLQLLEEYDSAADYLWGFVDGEPIRNRWRTLEQVPVSTPQSDAMSRELKRRGFKFVGSTICYAYMQSVGMVNDHLTGCFRYSEV